MEENTESAIYYIKKSFELKNLKLYKEAIEMLYKALSCEDLPFGKHNEIIAQIGDLYMLLKNYERAIEQYEKVLDTAIQLGLTDGFMQEKSSAREEYTPPFDLEGIII